jgi:hypothetical protein
MELIGDKLRQKKKQIPFPPQRANSLVGDPGFGNDKQNGMTIKEFF